MKTKAMQTHIFENMHASINLDHLSILQVIVRTSHDSVDNEIDALHLAQFHLEPIARTLRGETQQCLHRQFAGLEFVWKKII